MPLNIGSSTPTSSSPSSSSPSPSSSSSSSSSSPPSSPPSSSSPSSSSSSSSSSLPSSSSSSSSSPRPSSSSSSPPSSSSSSSVDVATSSSNYSATQFSPSYMQHTVAGVGAGVLSKSILQPLDLIKTRLQVQRSVTLHDKRTPFYSGVANAFHTIIRREGVLALYTGFSPNLFGSSVSWGCYFLLYNFAKSTLRGRLSRDLPSGHDVQLSSQHHFISASFAGVGTCFVTNPIWMIKTRLQLQFKGSRSSKDYSSALDALRSIVREEGVLSLYRGLGTALSLVSNGALQFMAYERIKRFVVHQLEHDDEERLGSIHFLSMGAVAKVFSSSLTYPLQVTKSRLYQRQIDPTQKQPGIIQMWRHMWRFEGIRAFYRGIGPQMCKTAPSSALTFLAYEEIIRFFRHRDSHYIAELESHHIEDVR